MINKKCLVVALVFSLFLIIKPISVKALDDTYKGSSFNSGDKIMRLEDSEGSEGKFEESCSGFLTTDGYDLIHEVLSYFRVLAPLLVVIFSAIDFAHAVLGKYDSKEDALETAKIKVGKRLLACIILIFIPTILKIILTTIGPDIKIPEGCVEAYYG